MQAKAGLRKQLIYVTLVPLIILGIVSSSVFFIRFEQYTKEQVKSSLKNLAFNGAAFYTKTGSLPVYEAGYEWYIYREDVCVAGSVSGAEGTYMSNRNYSKILLEGADICTDNVKIDGKRYMVYYHVMNNSEPYDIFACAVSRDTIWQSMKATLLPMYLIVAAVIAISSISTVWFVNGIVGELKRIRNFVRNIADEKLDAKISDELYNRNDELGDIGRDAVRMRNALRDVIEIDPLTQLYNRKTGEKKLKAIKERCQKRGQPYSIAIGDIDHFKHVNDTWGHDAGDVVLKNIAKCLSESLSGKAIVARWGGEEFFIAFENCRREKAATYLETALETIRNFTTIDGKGNFIKVTMTFGVVNGVYGKTDEELFKIADEKLYYGKENGRNQVVCSRKQEKD